MLKYLDRFKCNEDVADQFSGFNPDYDNDLSPEKPERDQILALLNSSEVLLAWYGGGCYDGSALVIYRHEGTLYEVNGGHCSCYGLEGQWRPERTIYKALAAKDPTNVDADQEFVEAYNEMLDILKKDQENGIK